MRVGENNRKDGQSTTIFSKTERKTNTNTSLIGTDVEKYFQCFYCILFKNSAKKAI